MDESPFIGPEGRPRLVDCAVLYFDLLGVSAMAKGDRAEGELQRFDEAIRGAFRYPIGAAAAEAGPYPASVFSDSVVQAVPILEDLPPAAAIFQILIEVAQLQTELAMRDYFARGAITLDGFYSHRGILFGPALVEAVDLEREVCVDPRIVLSPAATAALLRARAAGDGEKPFYETAPVLVDEDGVAFVDYLSGVFQADPAIDMQEKLRIHRDAVGKQLGRQQTNFHRWSKHRWVAEYHNEICFTYRDELKSHGGFEAFLVDSIHTKRSFTALTPAGQGPSVRLLSAR